MLPKWYGLGNYMGTRGGQLLQKRIQFPGKKYFNRLENVPWLCGHLKLVWN